jgi:hypothetical protein
VGKGEFDGRTTVQRLMIVGTEPQENGLGIREDASVVGGLSSDWSA